MKHEIKIPPSLKIGGFTYRIDTSKRARHELDSDGAWGKCRNASREIMVDVTASPEQISSTYLHEIFHAIDSIFNDGGLTEKETRSLTNGLHQVMEQLGVRFIK